MADDRQAARRRRRSANLTATPRPSITSLVDHYHHLRRRDRAAAAAFGNCSLSSRTTCLKGGTSAMCAWLLRMARPHPGRAQELYRLAGRARDLRRSDPPSHSKPARWTKHFDLRLHKMILTAKPCAALEQAGFGSGCSVWIAPVDAGSTEAEGSLKLQLRGEMSALRTLARGLPLDTLAEAYLKFISAFEPMRSALEADAVMTDLDALVTRVLLIHEYRRVELRDPILPSEVLPQDWPGGRARALCADLYKQLVTPSERWLDAYAVDENGAPLPPSPQVFLRFQE